MSYSFGQVIPVTGQNICFSGGISRMGSERTIVARQVLPTTTNNLSFGAPAVIVPDIVGGVVQPLADFIGAGSSSVAYSCSTVNTHPTIILASLPIGIAIGQTVTGTGVPGSTTVTAISVGNSNVTTITLSNNATATGTATLTFSNASTNIGLIWQQYCGIAIREVETMLSYPYSTVPGASPLVGYYAPGFMAEIMERGSLVVPIAYGQPVAEAPVYLRVLANSGIVGTAVGDLEAANDPVTTTLTGTLVAGTTSITLSAGTSVAVGQIVTGGSLPLGTAVASISSSTLVVTQAPTAAGAAGTPLTFSNTLALPDTIFRTGNLDANGMAEITIKNRRAA